MPTLVGMIVFVCTFLGALLGMRLRSALPAHHVDSDSRDSIKTGVGLIATMTALVLGLITASAKGSYDNVDTAVRTTAESLLKIRWLIVAEGSRTIPLPFLAIMLLWLTLTFTSFGLFSPNNPTVLAVFFVCSLSVGSALFLVLEMDTPFDGLLKVPADPMRYTLSHLDR